MNMSKIIKKILYPPIIIKDLLSIISLIFLIYSLCNLDNKSIVAIISYIFACYILTIWILSIIKIVNKIRSNKIFIFLNSQIRLKIIISLFTSLLLNIMYTILQFCLGIIFRSFWYIIISSYYSILVIVRFILLIYSFNKNNSDIKSAKIYGFCGILLLIINIILTFLMGYIIFFDKTFYNHKIIVIAHATYTFTSLIISFINIMKYKKYNNYIYSASKNISFTSSCVSMITLEASMLYVFGNDMQVEEIKMILALTGALVFSIILFVALYMIIITIKKKKEHKLNGQ